MKTKAQLAAILLLVGVVAGACRSAGDARATATTRPRAVTTTSTAFATTTTTPASTTTALARPTSTTPTTPRSAPTSITTTSPPAAPGPDDLGRFGHPEDAATHLYAAWRAGDRAKASRSGQPSAVNALFALPEYPRGFTFQGCTYRDVGYDCRFDGGAEALVMRVEGGASAGWRVTAVSLRA